MGLSSVNLWSQRRWGLKKARILKSVPINKKRSVSGSWEKIYDDDDEDNDDDDKTLTEASLDLERKYMMMMMMEIIWWWWWW